MATVEEAAALLEQKRKELELAQAAHADAIANAPPRPFEEIVYSLVNYLSEKFGHHAQIAALMTEMDKRIKLDAPRDTATANTAGV